MSGNLFEFGMRGLNKVLDAQLKSFQLELQLFRCAGGAL
jgi:hypothetical protein